jgi:biotin carboxyl carrier protein
MTYITTVNKKTYRIDTGEEGEHAVKLEEVAHTIDWQQIAPLAADSKGVVGEGGRYSLLIEGKSYDIFARRITKAEQKGSETYEIYIADQRFEVNVEDERTKLLAGLARSNATTGEANVQAPMPGLVIGVLLEQGAKVEAGQTVVVLEAMKMENDLSSPIAGSIKEIRINKGQTVDQGEVLVVVVAEE